MARAMRMLSGHARQGERGLSLLLVMAFMAISFLIISGVLFSTSNAALQGARHQAFYSVQEAATGAAERAVAGMIRDVRATGSVGPLSSYETVPDVAESEEWAKYEFDVEVVGPLGSHPELLWKYRGLSTLNNLYRVRARARSVDLAHPITSVVEQEIQVARIPLFSFMAFSEFDLTFITADGSNTPIGGRVHGNRAIYCNPGGNLTFSEHVTAASELLLEPHPTDIPRGGSVSFARHADSQANSLRLVPATVDARFLIELPPNLESPGSILGRQRLFNRADWVVLIRETGLVFRSWDGLRVVPESSWTNFISTNVVFRDKRESKWVHATDFDVGSFYSAMGVLGVNAGSAIYLADTVNYGTEGMAAIRLTNGVSLAEGGLTVATPNPLYVRGDYNTLSRKRALLAADAVTVLSGNWQDENSALSIANRLAGSTTVNAAILTGTVPSSDWVFDGGFINGLRLLEDWRGRTLTFLGAIATLFESLEADEAWRADPEVYFEPTRQFEYEPGFLTGQGVPVGTPVLHAVIRGGWLTLPPDTPF